MNEITRHDVPASIKDLIAVAQEAIRLDGLDIIELTSKCGDDWRAWADELCDIAYADRLGGHARVVQAAEKVWQEFGKTN